MKKIVVVLNTSRLAVPHKIEKARSIVQSMTGNAFFTSPVPDLASITASVDALEKANLDAMTGAKDDKAAVEPKNLELDRLLNLLASYVESIANQNDHGDGEHIALTSGMDLKGPASRTAATFDAENGKPGEIKLVTAFVPRSIFRFQMTTTPEDESTYQTIGESTRAKMTIDGLKSGTRYYFRVCSIGKDGPEPWSNSINLIVT